MPENQPETAQDLMKEMAKAPTLDRFFLDNPKEMSDERLQELVDHHREERAIFIAKGETTREEKTDE